MVPVRIALTPSRSPISRAMAGVSGSSGDLPRYFMLCRRCCWLRMVSIGDCCSLMARAWLRVVLKTGSPVLLTKSARMMESFIVMGPVPDDEEPEDDWVALPASEWRHPK